MNIPILYRPVGNDFLDQCSPLAFWQSEKGIDIDFPDSAIKSYTEEEFFLYCERLKLNPNDVKVYQ